MLRRILFHLAGLLAALLLGLGLALWLSWREVQAERRAPVRRGDLISGMVMIAHRDGVLEVLPWKGKRVRVRLVGLELWKEPQATLAFMDLARGQNVDLRVAGIEADGLLCGELSFLGRNLATELLRRGLARTRPEPSGAAPADPASYARAEREARDSGRGLWHSPPP